MSFSTIAAAVVRNVLHCTHKLWGGDMVNLGRERGSGVGGSSKFHVLNFSMLLDLPKLTGYPLDLRIARSDLGACGTGKRG